MDDQTTTTAAAPSAAEQIMTAAGWRRVDMGGNVQAWRKDFARGEGPNAETSGEFALITADGDCDADRLEIVWTAGRYRAGSDGSTVALDPHHTSLARAIERVATLSVAEEPVEPKASDRLYFQDQTSIGEE